MSVILLALVSLVAAQTPADDAPEPVPIIDGVPSEAEILAKLPPSPAERRSFRATWEERAELQRPARMAMRVTVKPGVKIAIERFDMSAADRVIERYEQTPGEKARSITDAPVWVRWLMGANRIELVNKLELDGARRALDVVERRVLWVLGAQANQSDRPQIRVDRITGRPQRIVERRGQSDSKDMLDIALFDWAESDSMPWLPRRLRVRDGDRYAVLHLVSSSVPKTTQPSTPKAAEP